MITLLVTYQGSRSQKDDDCSSVVESEDVVVYAGAVPLVEQRSHCSKHEAEHPPGSKITTSLVTKSSEMDESACVCCCTPLVSHVCTRLAWSRTKLLWTKP